MQVQILFLKEIWVEFQPQFRETWGCEQQTKIGVKHEAVSSKLKLAASPLQKKYS